MTSPRLTVAARALAWIALAAGAGAVVVLACGPFFTDFRTVVMSSPATPSAYDRGDLGVIKPTFARRYLVQAYRTLNGAPQVPFASMQPPPAANPAAAVERWLDARARVVAGWSTGATGRPSINPTRWLETFDAFDNCLVDSFDRAVQTLDARAQRYGRQSRAARDWVTAQDAVFANCDAKEFVAPAPPSAEADALERADRAYQTASALFYAMRYADAARAFRAIAADESSPWQSYGRYLAGRAWLRAATVSDAETQPFAAHLDEAAAELRAVLDDPRASSLHESAAGLLDMIASRRDPLARLDLLSRRLATGPAVSTSDLVNYTRLMDIVLEGTTAGPQKAGIDAARLLHGDAMTSWIVALQRRDPFAIEQWSQTRADSWLVAALWAVEPGDPRASDLLAAAGQLTPAARAYPLAAFLQARLLLRRGDTDAAWRLLRGLPSSPTGTFDAETLNLLDAARLAAAPSLDDLLAAAPRRVVSLSIGGSARPPEAGQTFPRPVWDDDVATVMNARLPLSTMIAAAESTRLPARLRSRVAQAAFTRAIVLDRHGDGRRAAEVLRTLSPPVRADLDRYLAAASETERRRAGILTLLRTPGLSINVAGMDTDNSYEAVEPTRTLGHAFARNWWCAPSSGRAVDAGALLFGDDGERPFPPFLTAAEREAVARDREALQQAGDGRTYLITAALAWASAQPQDADVAEALARSIEGWRWSPCTYGEKSPLPQRAFATLHRRYPDSVWTRRTPYWYE